MNTITQYIDTFWQWSIRVLE